ncbi:MAG: enoyl-CoA hydratase [Gordonia sp. (in: high G+C Gram-positive bacteria)]|nr:MAG: enoyl-CoA hydratase [Gordonia sp. (in: high G+C Gram-positive bacteria)]
MNADTRLQIHVAAGVAEIVLNFPSKKNALDDRGWRDFAIALEDVSTDPEVRVVTLSGSGGDLCSGLDLESTGGTAHPVDQMRILNRVAQRLFEMPKPVVTEIDGVAVGAGLSLVLGSDFVFSTPESRFSAIFARRGLSLDCGAAWGLTHQNGLLAAKRVAMLGDQVTGQEALELGWVTWLHSRDRLRPERSAVVERLLEMSPRALAETKSLLNHAASSTLSESLAMEALAQTINMGTDAPEAFEAFSEARAPRFDGRWRV